jgi:hypothetical protein
MVLFRDCRGRMVLFRACRGRMVLFRACRMTTVTYDAANLLTHFPFLGSVTWEVFDFFPFFSPLCLMHIAIILIVIFLFCPLEQT